MTDMAGSTGKLAGKLDGKVEPVTNVRCSF